MIQRELDTYLPFLATTKVLMAAVRAGVGREQAHEAIKEHAVAVALARREGAEGNDLADRLAADGRLGLDRATLAGVLDDRLGFVGTAPHQVEAFVRQVGGGGRRPRRRGRLPARAHPVSPCPAKICQAPIPK